MIASSHSVIMSLPLDPPVVGSCEAPSCVAVGAELGDGDGDGVGDGVGGSVGVGLGLGVGVGFGGLRKLELRVFRGATLIRARPGRAAHLVSDIYLTLII